MCSIMLEYTIQFRAVEQFQHYSILYVIDVLFNTVHKHRHYTHNENN